jgi:MinD-like ATPase involved in chromosome partitioning or flagellar assembly
VTSKELGRIITFYSYKGGTGRTMALSNVAWVLASNGYDVLLIDWDLEAPGLHRYLRPFLIDHDLADTPGLIDFMWDSAEVCMTPADHDRSVGSKFPSLEDYVVGLAWDFGERGSIDFIPAGQQDDNYAQRVNTFNWDNFYERLGGGKLLEAQRQLLRTKYDYILIDSRTGVSDTSGICTVQMPDILVAFFTLNRQSIDGMAAVASSVTDAARAYGTNAVPTRIENGEEVKRDAAIAYARQLFKPFLRHVQMHPDEIDPSEQVAYWKEVETPYTSFYAFEEVPAAFKDEPGSRYTVLAANERIAYWITDRAVESLKPAGDAQRKEVVDAYAFGVDKALTFERSASAGKISGLFRRMFRPTQKRPSSRLWRPLAIVIAGVTALVVWQWFSTRSELLSKNSELISKDSELMSKSKDLESLNVKMSHTEDRMKATSDTLAAVSNRLTGVIDSLNAPVTTKIRYPTKFNIRSRLSSLRDQLEDGRKTLKSTP